MAACSGSTRRASARHVVPAGPRPVAVHAPAQAAVAVGTVVVRPAAVVRWWLPRRRWVRWWFPRRPPGGGGGGYGGGPRAGGGGYGGRPPGGGGGYGGRPARRWRLRRRPDRRSDRPPAQARDPAKAAAAAAATAKRKRSAAETTRSQEAPPQHRRRRRLVARRAPAAATAATRQHLHRSWVVHGHEVRGRARRRAGLRLDQVVPEARRRAVAAQGARGDRSRRRVRRSRARQGRGAPSGAGQVIEVNVGGALEPRSSRRPSPRSCSPTTT